MWFDCLESYNPMNLRLIKFADVILSLDSRIIAI